MIRTLQHVGLTLPNPELARTFYSAFGLDVAESGGKIVARCQGREQDQIVVTEGPRKGLNYLSFGGNESDLPATRKAIEAHGGKLVDPRPGHPQDGIWFNDLDGNLIHLGLEKSSTPRHSEKRAVNKYGEMVRLGERGCPPFGLDPKPIRLGHVILFSPNPARQAAFYQGALGMKLSDRVGDDMVVFMRGASDGDHHLLGLLRDPNPGLHHASFEMDSSDHMELGARRIKEAGFQHVWGTGRHTVGSNLFHYFRDPWGSMAEYFYDIDFIPEGAVWEAKSWSKEQGLFLWSNDGPPPPDFPRNLIGAQ